MRANSKRLGVMLATSMVVGLASASTWNQDVAVGAKWSGAANWSAGVPSSADTAIFSQTQANTLDVDVDVAGTTRLQQVSQLHTFNGTGTIAVSANPVSHFQHIMHNTTSGTVTYNVGVSMDTQGSAFWGQSTHLNGGTTVFNNSYALTSGSLLNLKDGTHTFNGDLNVAGNLRLDGTVIIGGSGTTAISFNYLSTSGTGSKLYLNRTGAYTVTTPTGYLRIEKTDVHLGADFAVGAGTDVQMFGGLAGDLISDGDYDQSFGTLANGQTTVADLNLANSASTWTFEDSSSKTWAAGFNISNVDVADTVIRFDLGSGTGLTAAQVGQITLNGTALTTGDTTVDGGYLYITQAIPEPATLGLMGLVAMGVVVWSRVGIRV